VSDGWHRRSKRGIAWRIGNPKSSASDARAWFHYQHARADGGGGFDRHGARRADFFRGLGDGQTTFHHQSDSATGSGEQRFSFGARRGGEGESRGRFAVSDRAVAWFKKVE